MHMGVKWSEWERISIKHISFGGGDYRWEFISLTSMTVSLMNVEE